MSRNHLRPILLALAVLSVSLAASPASAQPKPAPTHLVQISLLAAAKTGPSELADLPANTRAAIEDVRQFLPFKSYRLLDTALLRARQGARTSLVGPDGRDFRVAFDLDRNQKPGELLIRSFELVEKFQPAAPGTDGGGDKVAPAAPATRLVMSSSFGAVTGQTVVVGTSRLNSGDLALMVLFTALP